MFDTARCRDHVTDSARRAVLRVALLREESATGNGDAARGGAEVFYYTPLSPPPFLILYLPLRAIRAIDDAAADTRRAMMFFRLIARCRCLFATPPLPLFRCHIPWRCHSPLQAAAATIRLMLRCRHALCHLPPVAAATPMPLRAILRCLRASLHDLIPSSPR